MSPLSPDGGSGSVGGRKKAGSPGMFDLSVVLNAGEYFSSMSSAYATILCDRISSIALGLDREDSGGSLRVLEGMSSDPFSVASNMIDRLADHQVLEYALQLFCPFGSHDDATVSFENLFPLLVKQALGSKVEGDDRFQSFRDYIGHATGLILRKKVTHARNVEYNASQPDPSLHRRLDDASLRKYVMRPGMRF